MLFTMMLLLVQYDIDFGFGLFQAKNSCMYDKKKRLFMLFSIKLILIAKVARQGQVNSNPTPPSASTQLASFPLGMRRFIRMLIYAGFLFRLRFRIRFVRLLPQGITNVAHLKPGQR